MKSLLFSRIIIASVLTILIQSCTEYKSEIEDLKTELNEMKFRLKITEQYLKEYEDEEAKKNYKEYLKELEYENNPEKYYNEKYLKEIEEERND